MAENMSDNLDQTPKKKGRQKLTLEESLEVKHISQALMILPRKVLDLRYPIKRSRTLTVGKRSLVQMDVVSLRYFNRQKKLVDPTPRSKPFRVNFIMKDAEGNFLEGTSFNPYAWMGVANGQQLNILADVTIFNGAMNLSNPEIIDPLYVGKVSPIYPAIRSKAKAEKVFGGTREALKNIDMAAEFMVANMGLRMADVEKACGYDAASLLKAIHDPDSPAAWEKAMAAAKALSVHEVRMKAERIKNRAPNKRSMLLTEPVEFSGVTLTGDQKRAIDEILADLRSGFPMMRLLSGDVGRGKTIPAVAAVASTWLAAQKSGQEVKVAVVLPNGNLVKQFIGQIERFFPEVRMEAIVNGRKSKIDHSAVLVGTSAITFLKDYKADLLVIDEQHKFSREQREMVSAPHTNILEATATAIPRSIALITHGGMDVSILRDSPVQKDIRTHLVDFDSRGMIYDALDKCVAEGKRALLIYPMVNESDEIEATTVAEGHADWSSVYGDRVGMVHGKMKQEEKDAAVQAMRDGDISILVASSIVEVGLDIPDIVVEVVVSPDRYGMNQLHQMRGRLARNGGRGDMYLYPEKEVSEEALARLVALVELNDGFRIAEADMELRGFGDLGADSDEQTGASEVTLRGITIMPSDFSDMNAENGNQPIANQKAPAAAQEPETQSAETHSAETHSAETQSAIQAPPKRRSLFSR